VSKLSIVLQGIIIILLAVIIALIIYYGTNPPKSIRAPHAGVRTMLIRAA
jgi:hypothetical protein